MHSFLNMNVALIKWYQFEMYLELFSPHDDKIAVRSMKMLHNIADEFVTF